MRNFPIGAMLAVAAVVVHTAPLLAGVWVWKHAQSIRVENQACPARDIACQLSELTRFIGAREGHIQTRKRGVT